MTRLDPYDGSAARGLVIGLALGLALWLLFAVVLLVVFA